MNHFETSESYYKACLNLDHGLVRGRYYLNSRLAVFDVTQSQSLYMTHKPKIGVARSGSPLIENLIPQILRQQTPVSYKPESESLLSWIKTLDKETNFVLWSSEHEVTGEYLVSDSDIIEIHRYLSTHRIISMQIRNPLRPLDESLIFQNPYAVLIDSNGIFLPDLARVLFTDKFKAPPLIASLQNIESVFQNATLNSSEPNLNFSLNTHLQNWDYFNQYAGVVRRVQDREILILPDVTGQSLKEQLVKFDSQFKNFLFAPSELPTWILDQHKNWWTDLNNEKLIRHMLVVSRNLFLDNSNFSELLIKAHADIQNKSHLKT